MENSSNNKPARSRDSLYWAMALVAVLAVGLTIGYSYNQFKTTPTEPVQVVVTATPNPDAQPVAQTDEPPAQAVSEDTPVAATTAENANTPATPSIMDLVLADARHFQGSADAPVTMIEFSDFK